MIPAAIVVLTDAGCSGADHYPRYLARFHPQSVFSAARSAFAHREAAHSSVSTAAIQTSCRRARGNVVTPQVSADMRGIADLCQRNVAGAFSN